MLYIFTLGEEKKQQQHLLQRDIELLLYKANIFSYFRDLVIKSVAHRIKNVYQLKSLFCSTH